MTLYAQYTAVALPAGDWREAKIAATAALTPGDLFRLPDGSFGQYAGLEAAAIGDIVTYYRFATIDVLCNATSDTYAAGAAVYFDTVNKVAKTSAGSDTYLLGTALVAKTSGSTRVRCMMNAQLLTGVTCTTMAASGNATVGGTLTVTGATTLSSTTAATGAVTFSGGIAASGSNANDFSSGTGTFKTSTGLNTIGGKVAMKVIATPVAAAVSPAALGSANIVTISSDGATKGVKLLTGVPGDIVWVLNTSATAAVLGPAAGGTINGLAANATVNIPASKGVIAICTAADTWTVYDLTALATTT